MSDGRWDHATTVLPNGKVLVTGGLGPTALRGSVELYDPVLDSWAVVDPMITPRRGHASALLRNGEVLVAGGYEGGA